VSKPTRFCVYIFFDLCGIPRYVGRGTKNRWKQHLLCNTNPRLAALIRKSGKNIPVVIVRSNLTHDEANETEVAFIKAIGRGKNGPLYNFTDGGEGTVGLEWSLKDRQDVSRQKTGTKMSTSFCEKMRQIQTGKKHRPETIEKMKKSAESCAPASDETRQKMKDAWEIRRLTPVSEETRRKKSLASKGKPKSPEHAAKLAAHLSRVSKSRIGIKRSQESKDKQEATRLRNGKKKTQEAIDKQIATRERNKAARLAAQAKASTDE
jgi:hypothetical protein